MFSRGLDIPRECLFTKPDEVPVAITVFAIKDIFDIQRYLVMFDPGDGGADSSNEI